MKNNRIISKFTFRVLLIVLIFNLLQLAFLNFEFIFLSVYLKISQTVQSFPGGWHIVTLFRPLIYTNFILAVVIILIPFWINDKFKTDKNIIVFNFFSGLMLVSSVLLFQHYLFAGYNDTLFSKVGEKQISFILFSPSIGIRVLILSLSCAFAFTHLWYWLSKIFSEKLFNDALSNDDSSGILKFSDFSKIFGMQIAHEKRRRHDIGLLGINIKNDKEIIKKHGISFYNKVMQDIYDITVNISRTEEEQLYKQTNIIISMLITDETGATHAIKRFSDIISREINSVYADVIITLNIAVFGYCFSSDELIPVGNDIIFQSMIAGITDCLRDSYKTDDSRVIYLKKLMENF